ncbi:lipopolysaccharide biosynthesis protein [Alcanivorax sp.]|uniref:lipopolysaccharide biosynthesis protein n=1 Tax=Alcanivorax sp. TaxID=1872427 RepID=UPI00258EAB9B|nr:lipopolysaccharide biosynthesis protein [Alcanivorax sp.]
MTKLNQPLAKRVFRAGLWTATGFLFARIIGVVRLAILARLLFPDDFGLFALVTVFIGGIVALSDAGIASAVIQKREPDAIYLSTAWLLECFRGVLLAAICWITAPWVADFFARPELTGLLHIAAFVPMIQGMTSLGVPLLNRDIAFGRILIMTLAHEVFQTLVAIGLAWWLDWKATALVFGLLAGHLAAVAASYWIHSYRPQLSFSLDAARELWAYGGHLLGAGILIYAMTNLDDAVIGRILGTEALGHYTVAFALAGYLTSRIVSLSNKVMFPAYAGIQTDVDRMLSVIQLHARLTTIILTPLVAGAALLPEAVIQLAVGSQWLSIAPVFVVLLAMGWVRGCATVFGPVLLARGRTRAVHKMKWIEFIVFVTTIVPAVHVLGILGAAWVLVMVYVVSLVLHLWLVRKELEASFPALVSGLFAGALPGLLAGFVAYGFVLTFGGNMAHGGWMIGVVFVVAWGGLMWIREREFITDLWARV